MPREKESYRDNIELISKAFPGKLQLGICEASKYMGIDTRTLKKRVKINQFGKIGIADLARAISG